MALNWYVLRTRPRSEYLAARALEREGFERYFPQLVTSKRGAGRTEMPLFPGYLFVRYDFNDATRASVQRLSGILGWVKFNGHAPSIPDEVVAEIDRRVESVNRAGGLWRRFRIGDKVRVVSGKMEGLAQVLEEPDSARSPVRVLLEFMGRLVPAQVPWHSLQPVYETSLPTGHHHLQRRTRGKGRWIRGFGPRGGPTP